MCEYVFPIILPILLLTPFYWTNKPLFLLQIMHIWAIYLTRKHLGQVLILSIMNWLEHEKWAFYTRIENWMWVCLWLLLKHYPQVPSVGKLFQRQNSLLYFHKRLQRQKCVFSEITCSDEAHSMRWTRIKEYRVLFPTDFWQKKSVTLNAHKSSCSNLSRTDPSLDKCNWTCVITAPTILVPCNQRSICLLTYM